MPDSDASEIRLLLVDANEDEFILLKDELGRIPGTRFLLDWCGNASEAIPLIMANRHEAYLIDQGSDGDSGVHLVYELRKKGFDGPCILLSIQGDYRVDLMAMRSGAQDYLDKQSLTPAALERSIFFAIERQRLLREREGFLRRIQETQRLESLGLLAGGLAHDFNNLRACILGNLEMIRVYADKPELQKDCVHDAETAVEQASALCSQMLAYSGKGKLASAKVEIPVFAKKVLDVLASSTPARIRVVREFGAVPFIQVDPIQLQQVLMNLVTNARDSIAGEGRITVRTGSAKDAGPARFKGCRIKPETPERDDYVWFQVEDSGSGMDAKTLDRIFDPFFTTKQQGRGLGLAAVMGIIKSHRGALEIKSAPGQGTSFTVYFPESEEADMEKDARPADPAAVAAADPVAGFPILFVDDNDSLLEVATATLALAGFEVLTAACGHEALEIFEKQGHRLRVVILDMTMPDIGGEEVYRRMAAVRPDLKVIFSSGYHESESISQLSGVGKVEFLHKPYRPGNLVQLVRRMAARESQAVR
jgi:signal transduction histidine kinase